MEIHKNECRTVLEHPRRGQSWKEIGMPTIPQCAIYRILCLVSGRVYIGQTMSNPARRWSEHKCALRHGRHSNPHLQAAWNKYGEQAFDFSVLATYATIEESNAAECAYIAHFQSIRVELYNIQAGGWNGRKAPESIAKMRKAREGYKASAETRARQSAANVGRKASDRSIAITRAIWTGRKHSEEAKAKMRGPRGPRKRKG